MHQSKTRLNAVVEFVRYDFTQLTRSQQRICMQDVKRITLWGCKYPEPEEAFPLDIFRSVQEKMHTILRQQIRLQEQGAVDQEKWVPLHVDILGFVSPPVATPASGIYPAGQCFLLRGSFEDCLFGRYYEFFLHGSSGHEDLRICPSCDRVFLARRKDQEFCTRPCLWREQKKRQRQTAAYQAYDKRWAKRRQDRKREARATAPA